MRVLFDDRQLISNLYASCDAVVRGAWRPGFRAWRQAAAACRGRHEGVDACQRWRVAHDADTLSHVPESGAGLPQNVQGMSKFCAARAKRLIYHLSSR